MLNKIKIYINVIKISVAIIYRMLASRDPVILYLCDILINMEK